MADNAVHAHFNGTSIPSGVAYGHFHFPVTGNMKLETCSKLYEGYQIPTSELYCNWTYDKVLCWPPTKAGLTTNQKCPPFQGSDTTKFVYKRCSVDGRWEGLTPNDTSRPSGYTHYNMCFVPEIQELLNKLESGGSDARRVKMDIARRTRILEIVGLSLSLAALIVSLAIFFRFRGLRNNRTRIHKNLFIAMVIQVVVRLTLYIDQIVYVEISTGEDSTTRIGIETTPYLCEACYALLEYARTAMFMWMFAEGLYLHNVITVTVFQENAHYILYSYLGWALPAVMTLSWVLVMIIQKGSSSSCWYGYNLIPYFWILEGPRLTVILLNFIFLLNIIRVLVMKLRQSQTSEIEQVRKAVRAAVVLLPLLGITNILKIPGVQTLDKSAWEFALWSYTAHFLTSFQGFFISLLYCFFNGEVRTAIMKSISVYLTFRNGRSRSANIRRPSAFVSNNYDTVMGCGVGGYVGGVCCSRSGVDGFVNNLVNLPEIMDNHVAEDKKNKKLTVRVCERANNDAEASTEQVEPPITLQSADVTPQPPTTTLTNNSVSFRSSNASDVESANWIRLCCRGPRPVPPDIFPPETQV